MTTDEILRDTARLLRCSVEEIVPTLEILMTEIEVLGSYLRGEIDKKD